MTSERTLPTSPMEATKMDPKPDNIDRIHFDANDHPIDLRDAIETLRASLDILEQSGALTGDEEAHRDAARDELNELATLLDQRYAAEVLEDAEIDRIITALGNIEEYSADILSKTADHREAFERVDVPSQNPAKKAEETAHIAEDLKKRLADLPDPDGSDEDDEDDTETIGDLFG